MLSLLALAVSAGLLLAFFGFKIGPQAYGLWTNMIASAVFSCWAFVIVRYVLESQGVQLGGMKTDPQTGALTEFFPAHEMVDWKLTISKAKSLDIVVHYYNRWARENFPEFVEFFGRGGQVRLVMSDPDDQDTLWAVRTQFFHRLTDQQLRERIHETAEVLREAFVEAASAKASLEIFYFPQHCTTHSSLQTGEIFTCLSMNNFAGL